MLIISVAKSNGPEAASQRALASMPGVFVANVKIPLDNGRTREVDGIVLSPTGIFVIEAKGFKANTPASGPLEVPFNGPWSIGGLTAEFHGGDDTPATQARKSAQTLAGFLRRETTVKQFVSAAVSITAPEATMAKGPVLVGDVAVCLDHDLPRGLSMLRQERLTALDAVRILDALRLAPSIVPTREAIDAEWAAAKANADEGWPALRAMREARRAREAAGSGTVVPFPVKMPAAVPGTPVEPQDAPSLASALFGPLVFLALIAGVIAALIFGLTRIGPEMHEADAAFHDVIVAEFPKAEPDWNTASCREADDSSKFPGVGSGQFHCRVEEPLSKKSARRFLAVIYREDDEWRTYSTNASRLDRD